MSGHSWVDLGTLPILGNINYHLVFFFSPEHVICPYHTLIKQALLGLFFFVAVQGEMGDRAPIDPHNYDFSGLCIATEVIFVRKNFFTAEFYRTLNFDALQRAGITMKHVALLGSSFVSFCNNLLMLLTFPTVGTLSVTSYDERKYFTSAVEDPASVTF